MQSGQASKNKSYQNENADLERIFKNITESPKFHRYIKKNKKIYIDRNINDILMSSPFNARDDNLFCILISALGTKDLDFIRYILESLEIHNKNILNKAKEYYDFPLFYVISNPDEYEEKTEHIKMSFLTSPLWKILRPKNALLYNKLDSYN